MSRRPRSRDRTRCSAWPEWTWSLHIGRDSGWLLALQPNSVAGPCTRSTARRTDHPETASAVRAQPGRPDAVSRPGWCWPPSAFGRAAYARRGAGPSGARGEAVAEPPAGLAGMLRGLRAGAGLTQEELAEATGV